jgi:nucleoside phosphorylase
VCAAAFSAIRAAELPVIRGKSWTTDAPFRETASIIMERQRQGIHVVEMEAAALLAFAQARKKRLVAIAHITNALGQGQGDFDKGVDQGVETALAIVATIAKAILSDKNHSMEDRQGSATGNSID